MNSGYNQPMSRPVIHISEAEAARDFAGVMARVRAGAEVRHRIRCARRGGSASRLRRVPAPPALRIHRSGKEARRRAGLRATHGPGVRRRSGRDHRQPQAVESARMGVILDSSILIAGERSRDSVCGGPGARRGRVWKDRRCALGGDRRGTDARHLSSQDGRRPQAPGNLRRRTLSGRGRASAHAGSGTAGRTHPRRADGPGRQHRLPGPASSALQPCILASMS